MPPDYQIGRSYRVPCAEFVMPDRSGKTLTVPVIGPLHEDAAYIGLKPQHYHVDLRFMSDRQVSLYALDLSWTHAVFPDAILAMIHPMCVDMPEYYRHLKSTELTVRRRRCYREMPEFPGDKAGYMKALQEGYRTARLDPEAPVCPHRGMPLSGLPSCDGLVVCPGHGLRWNLATGRIAPW